MNKLLFLVIGYVAGASSCLVGAVIYILLAYHKQRQKDSATTAKLNAKLAQNYGVK